MHKHLKYFLITLFIIAICSNLLHAADLKWDASTGEVTGYKIYYDISQESYTFSEDVGNVTQYDLDNLSLNEETSYFFVVRAYNDFGESGDSNVVTYTVPIAGDTTPPLSPVGVVGVVENGNILLTWTPNSEPDISSYRVYSGTSSRNYGSPISVEGTEYSLSGLDTDTTYYLAITAVDSSGNESGYSSPEIIKTVSADDGNTSPSPIEDVTAPSIFIELPTTDPTYETESDSMDISGTASDAVGVTQVAWANSRGGSGTATGTTSWSVAGITLSEGENLITVTVSDEAGNTSTDTLTLVYAIPDTAPPVVTIALPTTEASFTTNQSNVKISGTASDHVGVAQVDWWSSAGIGGLATGTANWAVDMIYLIEGENVITITARDEAGNESIDTLTVVYTIPDTTAPAVTITSPTGGTTFATGANILNIGGTASDAVGVTQVAWSNSRGGAGTATGTTAWSVAGVALAEGENVITVTASDAAGNSATDTLTVVYTIPVITDIQAPVLHVNEPTTGRFYFTRQDTIQIAGTASDNIGVKSVKWSIRKGGNGVASGTSNWKAERVPLAKRWNYVTITAEDDAGNKTDVTLLIFSRQ